jgi:hypothetical protein
MVLDFIPILSAKAFWVKSNVFRNFLMRSFTGSPPFTVTYFIINYRFTQGKKKQYFQGFAEISALLK